MVVTNSEFKNFAKDFIKISKDEFEIELSETVSPFLYKIGTCVLKSFNVSYNGQGVPQFYASTQAPIEVEISLGFQEVHIETSAATDYENDDKSGFGNGGDMLLPNDPATAEVKAIGAATL